MLNWDILAEQAQGRNDISDEERARAINAYASRKRLFGGRFFTDEHPLFWELMNQAPWMKTWTGWFAGLLVSFEGHPDFHRLIADLENPSRYSERMSVLHIAERLATGGFTVRFDPEVPVNGVIKKPDIFIQLNSHAGGFYLEVSKLHASDEERTANDVAEQFFETISPGFFPGCYSGRIEKVLSPRHLDEVLKQVVDAIHTSRQAQAMKTLEIDGVVSLAVGPASAENEIRKWAEEHGLQLNQLSGPGYSVPEVSRLAGKLRNKQKQLPPGVANVVAIHSRPFVSKPGSIEHFTQMADAFEEEVYKHPHIAFAIVVFNFNGPPTQAYELHKLRDHLCVNRQRMFFICDTTFIFRNRFADTKMTPEIEQAFIDSLTAQMLIA